MAPGILVNFAMIREADMEHTRTQAAPHIAASGKRIYKMVMVWNSGGTALSSRVSSTVVLRMVGADSLGATIVLMRGSSLAMTFMAKDLTHGRMVGGILVSGFAIKWGQLEPWVGQMVAHMRVISQRVESMVVERIVGQMGGLILVNGGKGANMERARLKLPEGKSAEEFGRMVSFSNGLMVGLQLWKITFWANKGT